MDELPSRGVSSLTLGLILCGAIGLTVKMDNENWSVAIHLGSAMAFLISLIWLWMEIRRDEDELPDWISFDPLIGMKWRKLLNPININSDYPIFESMFPIKGLTGWE